MSDKVKVTINVAHQIEIPDPVNFVMLHGAGTKIAVWELSEETLKEIGALYTAQLLAKRREKLNAGAVAQGPIPRA